MYIPGLTEALIAKGFAWLTAHIAASSASALTHAVIHALNSYIISHGVVATITTLAPIVISGSFVVGGVIWTKEKVQLVYEMLQDIKKGDVLDAAKKIISIANTLNTTYNQAADAISKLITVYYGDNGEIQHLCSTIKDIASKIK